MAEETTTTTETEAASAPEQPAAEEVKPALFDEPDETPPQSPESPAETPQSETPSTPEPFKAEDIKLPDGYEYDAETGKSFAEILNDETLSRKELGQKLFDLYQSQNAKMLEGLKAADIERVKTFEAEMTREKAEWLKQCQADGEYGGQNWEASQAVIDRGCKQLATPEAVALMQRYNLNTHPEIVRMFYRAGKLCGEDKSAVTGNGGGKEIDPAMAIFGESLRDYHKRKGEIQ